MTSFNIEDAAFAGVGLLVKRPLAAIAWAIVWAVLFAFVAVPFAGVLTQYVSLIAQMGTQLSPTQIMPLAPSLGAFGLLLGLGGLVVGAVVSCAVYRAVLEPESSEFAYLRLGDQEIQVMLVNFVRGVILFCINFTLSLILALLVLALGGMASPGGSAARIIGELVVFALLVWIQLRLAMAGPMTFVEHRFRLFESWGMTRVLTWRLLAVGAIVFIIGVVVYLAVASLGIAGSLALWRSGPPGNLQAILAQSPDVWIGALAPFIALIGVMVLIAGALLTPIGVAPWPYIYRGITSGDGASSANP